MTTANPTNRNGLNRVVIVAGLAALAATCGATRGQWEQVHKLTAHDAAANDYFGYSVAVSGTLVVVGAPKDDDGGSYSGSAYVFDATTGELLQKLTAEDASPSDYLGCSVSISGDTIVTGAYYDDHAGIGSGSAYVFDATTGQQLHKLTADDAAAEDYFGYSVSVDGNTIVVGAEGTDNNPIYPGSAYVFDATTGQQLHKLTADDGAGYDLFGCSVSVSGNIIVVGARNGDDAGISSGSAYVFDAIGGHQVHKLTAADAAAQDYFGYSIAVSGDMVIVGARGDDDLGAGSGSAYMFSAITGEQIHKLMADDGTEFDHFGASVAVSGDTILVGASSQGDAGGESGAVYLFDATTGEQLHKLTADDGAEGDYFGNSVSASGNTIGVGAYGNDDAGPLSGSAYVFREWSYCPADVNFDDVVNEADIMALFPAWGVCNDCREDINGDGRVDIDDLFAVLAAWGPCPCGWGDGSNETAADCETLVEMEQ